MLIAGYWLSAASCMMSATFFAALSSACCEVSSPMIAFCNSGHSALEISFHCDARRGERVILRGLTEGRYRVRHEMVVLRLELLHDGLLRIDPRRNRAEARFDHLRILARQELDETSRHFRPCTYFRDREAMRTRPARPLVGRAQRRTN